LDFLIWGLSMMMTRMKKVTVKKMTKKSYEWRIRSRNGTAVFAHSQTNYGRS